MIAKLISRRLLSLKNARNISTTISMRNIPVKKEDYKPLSVEEFFEKESSKSSSIPFSITRITNQVKKFITPVKLDSVTRSILDKSAVQLYYNCANNFPFIVLTEKFGLPDTVASWYKLTLMHVWMLLMRLHVSMDYYAYERFRTSLLTAMWHDIDTRLGIVSKEINERLTTKKDMQKMHGLYIQTLFEYDEGFLKNDIDLAGAIWRNLYLSKEVDLIQLADVVMYMRGTIAYLDTLETGELLVNGLPQWKQVQRNLALK
uniref:Ubiq_cyt_C_chap domain-containing protein n=1 Tax=Strongyloides venezuelensis TaxID=75913 RepID=A0A0K0F3U1_STRVS